MISWKLTVEKILNFSWGLHVSSTQYSWFTGDKQGTLTLLLCVVKPLYEQFFDWNCCVDIGSGGKYENQFRAAFFHWKNEDKSLGNLKYTIFLANWTFLGLFQVPGKNVLIKNMVHTCVFKKITKMYYIFWKNARNKCFRSKYQQFSANFGPIFAFPTPRN